MNRVWTKASAILLVVISLMFNGTYALAASATSTYIVTFQQATLVSNDHVGNEWAIAAQVAGQSISEGNSVKVKVKSGGNIKLYAYAEEQDKIPDEGEATKNVKVSSVSAKGSTVKLRVTVTENRGRYSGHQAFGNLRIRLRNNNRMLKKDRHSPGAAVFAFTSRGNWAHTISVYRFESNYTLPKPLQLVEPYRLPLLCQMEWPSGSMKADCLQYTEPLI